MKNKTRPFGVRLWLCFLLYAVIIFSMLWLLQTVFLQSFYNRMAISRTNKAAEQIAFLWTQNANKEEIDRLSAEHSLMILLTDWQGNLLYSVDEHNAQYTHQKHRVSTLGKANPYRDQKEPLNWEKGAFRNLPRDYADFLSQLSASADGTLHIITQNERSYICGRTLPPSGERDQDGAALYVSTPLGGMGGAVEILRIQLVWVTLASFIIGSVIAFFLSRQFSRPVTEISACARHMSDNTFSEQYQKGFCTELDGLFDTLQQTAAELNRLENARRELLANVSHDLRTPLTMIKGYAEMIRDLSGEDAGSREADLAVIIRETDRLTGLVNDILEYSALQQPEASGREKTFDFSLTLQSAAEQLIPFYSRAGYQIAADIQPALWVTGDPERLTRVIYNLVDNAAAHSPAGETIRLSLKATGDMVRAEVQDHGSGIPREQIPLIWDRYFTSKNRKNTGSKSGLGLAISKEILQQQKASFGVVSENGNGCIFWFELKKQHPDR